MTQQPSDHNTIPNMAPSSDAISEKPSETPFGSEAPTSRAAPQAPVLAEPHSGARHEPILVTIGDIQVTATQVHTPRGSFPLSRTQFTFQDNTYIRSYIPTWAIVLAILGALFFLLGLLFLLVRETETKGFVTASVIGPGFTHSTQLPVGSQQQLHDVASRVQHANNIAMSHRL